MFQTKAVEKMKARVLYSVTFFENLDFCDIMWKNIVERGGPQMTMWRTRISCWKPKATNKYTHSGCVILTVCPLQLWLQERASKLRYIYIIFLVNSHIPLLVLFFFTFTSSFLLIYSAITFLPFLSQWE